MSIDTKVEEHSYRHITQEGICKFDLAEGGNNPLGVNRGSHPFYEGTLSHDWRDILFVLHKEINDDSSFSEVESLFSELYSAKMMMSTARMGILDSNTRIDCYQGATEIYEEQKIPKDIWSQHSGIIRNALYNRFAENAFIIVPGYLNGFASGPGGALLSSVEFIPPNKKAEVRKVFKQHNYNGKLLFWG
ncbi:hypothetical protein HOB91_02985 [Candidatus Woesearchaeota archaeon]|jgi:hypothetical protein|nr:hypothetical protein [Candidatus Woesearchaeota archaeon]MBT6402286.1 hypothetical protein [Candidatus Woesearchaeota archaeon]